MEEKKEIKEEGFKQIRKRYRMLDEIGKGGTSRIFLVYDEKLGVKRIIKRISWEETGKNDLWIRQQFITEVYILNRVRHTGIPKIYDYYMEKNSILLVLEYIEGDNLFSYIKKEGLKKEKEVLNWALQLCRILRYLHEKTPPIMYLDLKPSNIIRDKNGQIFLIDFGTAQEKTEEQQSSFIQGTKEYAAPEQLSEKGMIDIRTDIYSFGKVLQFCLWGSSDFSKRSRNPVHKDMEAFLRKCTDAIPENRYQSTREVEKAIKELLGKYPYQVSRNKRIMLRMTVAALLITAILFLINMKVKSMKADSYLTCAQEALEADRVMYYYEEALKIAPWKEEIYTGMLQEYVLPDYFSTENAARLLNILEETKATKILFYRNKSLYTRFCYEMGIGYFYYMGGIKGKQESNIWFVRALESGDVYLSEMERRRAECHRDIGRAYQTFLMQGGEKFAGRRQENYKDFFQQLEKLVGSDLYVEQNVDMSQRMLYEVLTELSNYIDEFLSVPGISSDKIIKILNDMEIMIKGREEDSYPLYNMIRHIRKRIQIVEEKSDAGHSETLDMDIVEPFADQ